MFTLNNFKMSILSIFIFSTIIISQTNRSELFEIAKYTMETKGDLQSAINLFEEIIKQYPTEKEYGAKSQFYIGLCYQKQGLTKAKRAFEKVISNYPTETEIVSLAKEKLSAIKVVTKNIEIKNKDFQLQQVWAEPFDDMGMPSPDGRYISYVNWNVPCLAIYDLNTGKSTDIVSTTGTWEEGNSIWPESSIWSPDGKKLAYVWYGKDKVSIRIVGIDSSEPEIILADENAEYSHPCSWSSDAKHILAVLCHGKKGHEIVFVSVKDHSVKSLKKFEGGSHPLISLSPDNKTVAYSFTPDLNSPKTDIFLLNIEDGTEKILIDHPETDFSPLWMPDGKHIIFFSDRTGSVSVWSQKVADGSADGKEIFIKNLNRLDPKAITQNGDLFMIFHEGGNDVYNAIIDPETGKVISAPKRVVESNIGWNSGASFSPDGKSMAYVSQRGVLNTHVSWGQQSLIIRDLQTGEERELIPRLKQLIGGPITPLQWSPNGDEIMGTGRDEVGHNGAFIINLKDTSYLSLLNNESFIGGNVIWSKKNTKLYYRIYGIPDKNGLYAIDRHSNKQTRILSEDNIQQLALHPDGNLFALVTGKMIKLFNLESNELKELIHFQPEFKHTTMAWSPDGKWLYFANCLGQGKVELRRIDKNGRNEQLINNSFPHIKHLTIHPDGKRIAFTVGEMSGKSSLWVMKNYLPK